MVIRMEMRLSFFMSCRGQVAILEMWMFGFVSVKSLEFVASQWLGEGATCTCMCVYVMPIWKCYGIFKDEKKHTDY
jgi:hypothetical protein